MDAPAEDGNPNKGPWATKDVRTHLSKCKPQPVTDLFLDHLHIMRQSDPDCRLSRMVPMAGRIFLLSGQGVREGRSLVSTPTCVSLDCHLLDHSVSLPSIIRWPS
jgi:hypothetical protein